MSLDNARKFLKNVEGSKDLQNIIKVAGNTDAVVLKVANDSGLACSADELKAAQDELWGDLSDKDLKNVAGGGMKA